MNQKNNSRSLLDKEISSQALTEVNNRAKLKKFKNFQCNLTSNALDKLHEVHKLDNKNHLSPIIIDGR